MEKAMLVKMFSCICIPKEHTCFSQTCF